MNQYALCWEMDGCQWDVLSINMYSNEFILTHSMKIGTYVECIRFVYEHLMDRAYTAKEVTVYFPELTVKFTKQDCWEILAYHYPEEMI